MTNACRTTISVIVPVYNVEKYLAHCVHSILQQTYSDWELVLVDDGSTDKSGQICDDFVAQHKKIKVIHKTNGGLSDARNAGTMIAQGKYITYVDSDDWIAPNFIETLYSAITAANADVAVCDLVQNATEEIAFERKRHESKIFDGPGAMEEMLYQTSFDTSACGKLYNAELMRKFCFPKGKLYEDLFLIYKVLFTAHKVVYIPQELYAYRKTTGSIMNQRFTLRMFDELDAADEIVAFVGANCPEYLPAANARRFSSYSQVLRWMKGADRSDEAVRQAEERIWRFLKGYRRQMLLDKNARAKNRAAAALALLGKKIYSAP